MSDIKPKKMVSRSIAIALGIICIILVAGLGVVIFLAYAPTSGSLQTTYNNYVADHHHTCIILLASLFGVILSFEYQSQADNVAAQRLDRSIVYANNQTLYLQAGGYYSWYQIAEHSGYWSVDVQSSTNKTYVQVEYSWLSAAIESLNYGAHQISFENMTYVGTSGQVNFATVVWTQCGIRVGNNNTDIGANVTVTIVYYY